MTPTADSGDTLLQRLYALYELPDAGGEDGPAYLGLRHLRVASFGSRPVQELVRTLRQAANPLPAILCRDLFAHQTASTNDALHDFAKGHACPPITNQRPKLD